MKKLWVPQLKPIFLMIFQGSHGFMTSHRWHDTVGAFIDVEASGTGGFGKLFELAVYGIENVLKYHKYVCSECIHFFLKFAVNP